MCYVPDVLRAARTSLSNESVFPILTKIDFRGKIVVTSFIELYQENLFSDYKIIYGMAVGRTDGWTDGRMDGRTGGEIGIRASWGRDGALKKNSLFVRRTAEPEILSATKNFPLS
jgi:hypothetical protein